MTTSMIGLVIPAVCGLAAVLFGFAMRERRASDPVRERSQLNRMRLISLVEGTTLILLVFVAVPLKRFGGQPIATAVMGPIHGAAFLLYVAMLVRTVSGGGFARGEVARMVVAALIPFGAFVNERALRRRQELLDWRHLGD